MKALACARVRVLLEAYVDGDLARTEPETSRAVRDHLVNCADCRRQHEQAVSLPFRMKALRTPAPPASLVAVVMSSIAPQPQASRAAWGLLVPEGLLAAFILWYVSGLDGLTALASGAWSNLQGLLVTKHAVLSCMRIQASHGNPRVFDTKLFECPNTVVNGIYDAFLLDGIQSSAQTQVSRDVHGSKVIDHQEHSHFLDLAE